MWSESATSGASFTTSLPNGSTRSSPEKLDPCSGAKFSFVPNSPVFTVIQSGTPVVSLTYTWPTEPILLPCASTAVRPMYVSGVCVFVIPNSFCRGLPGNGRGDSQDWPKVDCGVRSCRVGQNLEQVSQASAELAEQLCRADAELGQQVSVLIGVNLIR